MTNRTTTPAALASRIRDEIDGLVPVSEAADVDQLQAALKDGLASLGIEPDATTGATLLVLAETLLDAAGGDGATAVVLRLQSLGLRFLAP